MIEDISKALKPLPQEHIHECVAERIFNDLVPHLKKVVVDAFIEGLRKGTLTIAQ